MRTAFKQLAVVAASLLLTGSAIGQVDVTASAGTPTASYTTLKGAFDAVNAGTHQGVIGIGISGDTTETAPAVLNASGAGAATYASILITPTGGAARQISGAIAAGSPLIDLNGADNVTIDGLNAGGNSLTIANTTVSATSATSTVRFIGGATGNTITNSSILGSGTMSVATNGAVIFFSTDAVTANGNDNNTISNNNIGPAGANLPTKAILGNGSTTTTAIGNSGIVITNNNVFDYFGAAVTSAGVATNGGCNGWTITNNRFFQTGTRTWTTGALHNAINIANSTATSGAQGFTITGNTIGFASSAQTGTYTLTGSTGKFVGIQFNGITGGVASSISNNTIASVSLTGVTSSGTGTSSPFLGILVNNGLVSTNGNTIGSQAANGSLTFSTTTTTATDVIGVYNFSVDDWTANGNAIGGISVTNLGASGTFVVYGMRANTSTTKAFNADSNNVGGTVASSIQLASTGASSQVVGMITANAIATWTSNVVRNLTSNNGTGTGTGASVIGMSLTSATPSQTLTQNTISSLSNTHATAATVVTGIQFTGGSANVVQRNLIHGLTVATSSAAAEVNGIRVAGGTTVYRNNMIALGAGIPNAIGTGSTTGGVNGINEPLGTDSFFHNSVYVGGAPTSGVGPSYAFNSSQTVNTRSFRDNIFFNARSNAGATGKNYAVRVGGTTANPTGLTIDNNVYHASGAGAVFGFFNSLDVADLAAWKLAVGQDASSFQADPKYNDPTGATPDLHLHPTNPTVAEGNGADVGVTDDFDGQTRSGLTPVDIGADAGNFAGFDLAPPTIAYTPLSNTTSTSSRALTATVTDLGSGVPTAGAGLPVVYFRKGTSGAFSSTQALWSGGSTYAFTIDYSLVTGGSVATGDTIQYYVVAQDGAAAPNVGASPAAGAGGLTANPPAAATPPTTPNSYRIAAAISGVRTVCASGCDFATLTGATGVFNAINTGVVTGNVDVQVAGDLTAGEDGTSALNALQEEPAGSGFTVRLYPTGAPRAITGAFNGALVRLNGSSRVTIDGSVGGTGTDRSLTIQNSSTTTPTVVLIGSTGTTPITGVTLKNCVVVNGANTSSAVVISDAGTLGNAGYFSNITVQNNDVQKAFVGVFATGGTTPQHGSDLTYSQNTLNASGVSAIRDVGLYVQGVNGVTVSQNAVGNIDKVNDENDVGIWLATGTVNATVSGNTVGGIGYTGTGAFAPIGIYVTSGVAATGNVVTGNTVTDISSNGSAQVRGISVGGATSDLTIEKNEVQGVVNTNTGTYGAYGIDVSGGNNIVVRNNFVSGVSLNMTGGAAFSTTFGAFGIRVGAGTGHSVQFNSVNLDGLLPGTATSSLLTAAFVLVATTSTGCDVRDNVFANNISGGTTSIAHVAAYLPAGGTSAMNLTWNNNAYYFGTDAARQGAAQAGTTAGTNFFTALPLLAAYSGTLSPGGTNDGASLATTTAVPFLSATDLHLQPGTLPVAAGVPIAGVTTDIDGDARGSTPEIGADELPDADLSITKTDGVAIVAPGGSTTYTITASNAGPSGTTGTVADTFPAVLTCTWTCSGAGGGTCAASGSGNLNDAVGLPSGGSVTYTVACSIAAGATGTLSNTATVTGVVTDPSPGNNIATDVDTLVPSADLSITKTDGVTSVTPGGSTTYTITASNAGPSGTTGTVADTFPAALTCTWTCSGAGGGSCTASGSGNLNDAVGLPSGGSVTYTAACSIAAGATGTLSNTATVSGAATDPIPGNDSATDVDTVALTADLSITKTDGVTSATPGGSTTYTITASNAGPSATTGTVADTFPAALTCTWTCSGAGGGSCTASGSGNLNDAVGLPSGGSVTYTAACSIAAGATGTLSNTATVSGAATDPNAGNDSATDVDTLVPSADVAITETADTYAPGLGTNVTFTITAKNNGPSSATGVQVTDVLPAGLTWVSDSGAGSYVPATGVWTAGGIPVGGSISLQVVATVTRSAAIVNQATRTAQGEADPDPSNNTALVGLNSTPLADLQVLQAVDHATPGLGSNVTFTVDVRNAGPSNASGVVIADPLPAGVSFVSSTASQGSYNSATGNWNVGSLNGLGTATLQITATVTSAAPVTNTATAIVLGERDDNGANDSSTVTLNGGTLADLALGKTASQEPVAAGTTFAYTIVVVNAGPAAATGVTVTDDLTSVGATLNSAAASQGSCSGSPLVSCNLGSLPPGGSATITLNVTKTSGGSISNVASVAGNETDPNLANNSNAEATTPVELLSFQVD